MGTDRPLRVLVVEGDRGVAGRTAKLLARWGHEARVRYDPGEAVPLAAAFLPDVVLADGGRPSWVKGLRNRLRPRQLGLIALVDRVDCETCLRCSLTGFHFIFAKDYRPETLRLVVTTLGWSARMANGPGELVGDNRGGRAPAREAARPPAWAPSRSPVAWGEGEGAGLADQPKVLGYYEVVVRVPLYEGDQVSPDESRGCQSHEPVGGIGVSHRLLAGIIHTG